MGNCSVCGKLEFLRTAGVFGNGIFLHGGRFALFCCSSPEQQLGDGAHGTPPGARGAERG